MSASHFVRRLHASAFVAGILVALPSRPLRAESPRRVTSQDLGKSSPVRKRLAHVQRLVDFGPRPPASDAIEKSRDYIDNQLRLAGWKVDSSSIHRRHAARESSGFVNLIARFSAQTKTRPLFLVVLPLRYKDIRHHPICWSERRWFEHRLVIGNGACHWTAPESSGQDRAGVLRW